VIILKNRLLVYLCAILLIYAAGCGIAPVQTPPQAETETAQPLPETAQPQPEAENPPELTQPVSAEPVYDPKPVYYGAVDARLIGNTRIEGKISGFTGAGYVAGFENDGDACEFTVMTDKTGFYDLNFRTSSGKNGYKENNIYVNGANVGVVSVQSEDFTNSVMPRIYLEAGENKIIYEKYWGWVYLDGLIVVESPPQDPEIYNVSPVLVNENAADPAKRLMSYLTDIYGEYILAGQYSENGNEVFTIKNLTGKSPAVLGLDLIDYTPSRVANGATSKAVERAIAHHNDGGIVTLCWHWNAPEDYLTGVWYRGFYTNETNIDLLAIMSGEDEKGYGLLLRDIDAIAEQLKILQDNGVPVLWRPLHEASGGWFWWGAGTANANIVLWRLLYERLTVHHGLNNLIWLWNGQSAGWYPGDDYVDIVGEDIYAGERVYSSQIGKFTEAVEYTQGRKMVVLSENGTVPDIDLAIRDGAMWGFFATWQGEFVLKGGLNRLSEQYTETAILEKAYNHEKVITLDELPDLKTYEIKTQ